MTPARLQLLSELLREYADEHCVFLHTRDRVLAVAAEVVITADEEQVAYLSWASRAGFLPEGFAAEATRRPGRPGKDAAGGRTAIIPPFKFEIHDLPWRVRGVVATESARYEEGPRLTELRITARPGGRSITADMIRGVKLGEALRDAIEQAAWPTYAPPEGGLVVDLEQAEDRAKFEDLGIRQPPVLPGGVAKRVLAKRGKRPDPGELAVFAEAYRAAVAAGRTDRYVAVGEACNVSTATAGRRIAAARAAGLLDEEDQ